MRWCRVSAPMSGAPCSTEMLRLGVVRVDDERIELDTIWAPRGDFAAMAETLRLNLADHAGGGLMRTSPKDATCSSRRCTSTRSPRLGPPVAPGSHARGGQWARVLRQTDKRVAHDAVKGMRRAPSGACDSGVYFYAEDAQKTEESEMRFLEIGAGAPASAHWPLCCAAGSGRLEAGWWAQVPALATTARISIHAARRVRRGVRRPWTALLDRFADPFRGVAERAVERC